MRNLKKVLSLALAMVMLLGMMVVGASAADATEYPDYGDVSADKQEAVQVITALSVIDGTEKGMEPQANLTRAMAATIITRALLGRTVANALSSQTCVFTDVPDWAKGAVQYCADMGIVYGIGNNLFGSNNPVKGTEFAAMLLRAVDPEGDYSGSSWANKVIVAANKYGLSDKVAVTATELTREGAAQMAFNTITSYSPSGATAWGVDGKTFDSFIEAYLYADNLDKVDEIEKTPANDTLAATVFGLTSNGDATDDFGSAIKTWTLNDKVVATVSRNTAVKTYTAAATDAQIRKDLDGYTVNTTKANYLTDGVAEANNTSRASVDKLTGASDSIRSLTGNGRVVELYATNKVINKIVVKNELVGTISRVNAASGNTDRSVTVGGKTFTTENFERGDVVVYTVAKGKIAEMALAEVVEGAKVTSHTSTKVTTDNGVYDYAAIFTAPSWSFTGEYALYLDSYGYVVMAEGDNVATPSTFAYIESAEIKAPTSTLDGSTPTVRVRAVLGDGTVKIYDVPVTEVTSSNSGDHTYAAVGDYVAGGVVVWDDSAKVETPPASGNYNYDACGQPANLTGKVFGYSLDGSRLTLSKANPVGSGDMEDGKYYTNTAALTRNYVSDNSALDVYSGKSAVVDGSTTFVVISGSGTSTKTTVYTGKITTQGAGLVAANTNVVLKAANGTTGVATVVFTTTTNGIKGTAAAGYAYVDGTEYTGSDGKYYIGTTINGEEITLTKGSQAVDAAAVYGYDDQNRTIEKKTAGKASVLSGMIGTPGNPYYTVTDDTLYYYVDEELNQAEDNICVVIGDDKGNAVEVFVIRAEIAATRATYTSTPYTTASTTHPGSGSTFSVSIGGKAYDVANSNTTVAAQATAWVAKFNADTDYNTDWLASDDGAGVVTVTAKATGSKTNPLTGGTFTDYQAAAPAKVVFAAESNASTTKGDDTATYTVTIGGKAYDVPQANNTVKKQADAWCAMYTAENESKGWTATAGNDGAITVTATDATSGKSNPLTGGTFNDGDGTTAANVVFAAEGTASTTAGTPIPSTKLKVTIGGQMYEVANTNTTVATQAAAWVAAFNADGTYSADWSATADKGAITVTNKATGTGKSNPLSSGTFTDGTAAANAKVVFAAAESPVAADDTQFVVTIDGMAYNVAATNTTAAQQLAAWVVAYNDDGTYNTAWEAAVSGNTVVITAKTAGATSNTTGLTGGTFVNGTNAA